MIALFCHNKLMESLVIMLSATGTFAWSKQKFLQRCQKQNVSHALAVTIVSFIEVQFNCCVF